MKKIIKTCAVLIATTFIVPAVHAAAADDYPNRPVRIVAPSTPGAVQDVIARLVAQRLSSALGQQFIVENRPGASTNVGNTYVARAKPDGYTLLLSSSSLSWYPDLFKSLAYDPFKDFVSIASVAKSPALIYGSSTLAASNVKELVALSMKTPNGLDYAGTGVGVIHHLALEQLKLRTGANIRMIPFNGATPAVTAVMSGQIPFGMLTLGSLRPQLDAGRIKALAVVADQRSSLMPGVSTLEEQGLPAIDATIHFPLVGPVGIPADILAKLEANLKKIIEDPSIKDTFKNAGLEPAFLSGEETSKNMRARAIIWRPVINSLNIKLD